MSVTHEPKTAAHPDDSRNGPDIMDTFGALLGADVVAQIRREAEEEQALLRNRTVWRHRAMLACEVCASCGRELAGDDPVWRQPARAQWPGCLVAPVCVDCKADRGWEAGQCICGRTVYNIPAGHYCYGGIGTHAFVAPDVRAVVACCQRCRERTDSRRWRERHRGTRDRACQLCGEAFTPPRADGRYCSGACRQKAYRRRNGGAA